jgi:ribosomal protein L39E
VPIQTLLARWQKLASTLTIIPSVTKKEKKPRLQKKKKRQAGIPVWCNLKVESTRDELMIVSATFFFLSRQTTHAHIFFSDFVEPCLSLQRSAAPEKKKENPPQTS